MRTLNFLVLAVLGLIFASCDDDDHLGDWEKSVEFGQSGPFVTECVA